MHLQRHQLAVKLCLHWPVARETVGERAVLAIKNRANSTGLGLKSRGTLGANNIFQSLWFMFCAPCVFFAQPSQGNIGSDLSGSVAPPDGVAQGLGFTAGGDGME